MESIKKTVGDNLKQICKVKGIKNRQIADFIGVSESCVSNWFRGRNSFDVDNLYAVCKYLGVSVDQVFGIEPIVYGILNEEENDVIVAYRSADKGTQASVRKLLDVETKKESSQSAI